MCWLRMDDPRNRRYRSVGAMALSELPIGVDRYGLDSYPRLPPCGPDTHASCDLFAPRARPHPSFGSTNTSPHARPGFHTACWRAVEHSSRFFGKHIYPTREEHANADTRHGGNLRLGPHARSGKSGAAAAFLRGSWIRR